MPDAESLIPEITDDDIDWVCSVMGLRPFDEHRRAFLKCQTTVDVSACPGSGKTTLVVAKLAILAKKWPHRTRGICVLSHTNAAREQIEHRLGRTVSGQRLLAYPHFVDTIHGFVNRHLALPWLYSNGYPSPTIDDDITIAKRRSELSQGDYRSLQYFLKGRSSDFDKLRICGRNLSFNLLGGKPFSAKPHTPSFKNAKRAIEAAARAGYFCHDEMFVWASALLEDHNDLPAWLAHRFPLVILDEMQDTSYSQASFLDIVFPRKSGSIVVQRVGDPNQKIFDSTNPKSGTIEWFPDPDPEGCLEIPNSYRFGADIASLASPFAVCPVGTDGLSGIGPRRPGNVTQERKHAIFVFPDDNTNGVLEAYGRHALSVLGDVSEGITAVGHVHRDDPEVRAGHAHYPKAVGHYWNGYSAGISRKNSHQTLAQYVLMAQGLVADGRTLSPGVEKITHGIFELAKRLGDIGDFKRRARTHRVIVNALEDDVVSLAAYRAFLRRFLVEKGVLRESDWLSLAEDLTAVATALCSGGADKSEADKFLEWPRENLSQEATALSDTPGPNVFRVSPGGNAVDIRLGSIHSVKGQTHLATLLLSTYWYDHSAKWMMPWLTGEKSNGEETGNRDKQRLRHSYVAMTRPSHLLCLAVPNSALGDDKTRTIAKLKERGWHVARVIDGVAEWIE